MGEGQCLDGVLQAKGTWPFFSSEKSCLITSKKLLNGLPRCTQAGEEEEKEQKKRNTRGRGREEQIKGMNSGVHRR